MRRAKGLCVGLLVLLFAAAIFAADEPGSQQLTRQRQGITEARSVTVDPAVPFSDMVREGGSGGDNPLLEVGQFMWETSDLTGLMDKVTISDDGSIVAIGVELNNFSLRVHNGQTGALIYEMPGNDGSNSVAVTSNGSHVAYATGNMLHYLTSQNSTPIWSYDIGAGRYVGRVAFSPDGSHIILTEASTLNDSLWAYAFDVASSTPVWTLGVPFMSQWDQWIGAEYSADGATLVVTARFQIYTVDPATGAVEWQAPGNNTEHPARVSGDGRVICCGSNGGRFTVFGWDNAAATYVQLWSYAFTGGQSNWATASAVSGDGMTVACGSMQFIPGGYEGYVAVFDTYGGGVPLWLSASMGDLVGALEMSYDGLTIAAASWGYLDDSQPDIRVWEKYDSTPFYTYTHTGSPNDLDITPDGTRLIAGGKGTHNRVFGNGGRAYVFSLDLEGGTVSGTVTLTGATDHSGVIVEAQGQNRYAVTDAAGAYAIAHVPAGTHTIVAHKLGYTTASQAGVVVTDGGTTPNINFTLTTVGVAPQNLTATTNHQTRVTLNWNPVTLRAQRLREQEIRMAVGDEDPVNLRGPVAATAPRQSLRQESPWGPRWGSGLDELDEADSIRVYRGATSGGPYQHIASVAGDAVSYADSFRIFPTFNYYYVVTALYPDGESVYSNEVLGTLDDSYLVYAPVVPALTAPVTFDGVLSAGEWTDAIMVDGSDVFGYDGPNPPQSVYFRLKYDEANDLLLIAGENFLDNALGESEGLGIYLDDDDNNQWSYDRVGTEGNWWAYYSAGGSTLRYRSLTGGPYSANYYVHPNPQMGFSAASGHVTVEVAIPMGWHNVYDLALWGPDKTPGLGIFMIHRDEVSNPFFDGWWPQNMPSIVSNPEAFGDPSIQADLFVPPLPPTNINVVANGSALDLTWNDPTVGVDNLPLEGLAGIDIYRNGELYDVLSPGVEIFTDPDVVWGAWYEYALAAHIMEGDESFEGPRSQPVGTYAGASPDITVVDYDDNTIEQYTVVDFNYNGNRFGQRFDMPPNNEKVYTIQLATNGDGPIGVGVTWDDSGIPGEFLAGPYFLTSPVLQEIFEFHIPGLEPPLVEGNIFWVTLDWTPESPGNPGIATDVNGTIHQRSYYYTNAAGWTLYQWGNWMIRAGVGLTIDPGASDPAPGVAHEFRLLQNYPNPFNPETNIPYELAVTGETSLKIFNLMGQEVVTLISGKQNAGYHVVHWNGRDNAGAPVTSGTYLVQLKSSERTAVTKMLLIR